MYTHKFPFVVDGKPRLVSYTLDEKSLKTVTSVLTAILPEMAKEFPLFYLASFRPDRYITCPCGAPVVPTTRCPVCKMATMLKKQEWAFFGQIPVDVTKRPFLSVLRAATKRDNKLRDLSMRFFSNAGGRTYLLVPVVATPDHFVWVGKEAYDLIGVVDHAFTSGLYYRQCLVEDPGEHSIVSLLQTRLVGKLAIEMLLADAMAVNKNAFMEFLGKHHTVLHHFYNHLIDPADPVTKAFGEFYKQEIAARVR